MLPILESEYFGKKLGFQTLYQVDWGKFNQICSSSSSETNDNTGQRLYAGAHVAIRFIVHLPIADLLDKAKVAELGCGTGCFGLMALSNSGADSLLLTDGTENTLSIAHFNKKHLLPNSTKDIDICKLEWGDTEQITAAINKYNCNRPFDIVIGCELMYFLTDIPSLLSTVLQLTNYQGLFIHAHLFRRAGQEGEVIEYLSEVGWRTLEVPVREFIPPEELSQHPAWNSMRALISGPRKRISDLLTAHSTWIVFQPTPPPSPDEKEEVEEGGLHSLFN
ncbi:hypothetical protein EON63_04045 [archaeon]|nr:MAG: hypothetical protein EON63_04045 [archaeon]